MPKDASGGRGGNAIVSGMDSTAIGGDGGDGRQGKGGDGGNAEVLADRSHARGGQGGRAGIGNGSRGGDAYVFPEGFSLNAYFQTNGDCNPPLRPSDTYVMIGEEIVLLARGGHSGDEGGRGGDGFAIGSDASVFGGQGGEAQQADGRGGRGGRAFMPDEICELLNVPMRRHMRWPYFEPVTEPGRGGDAPDTSQYKARRLIVEKMKKDYFGSKSLPLSEVWWDREIVPIDWINSLLQKEGHRWGVQIFDDEYVFNDL